MIAKKRLLGLVWPKISSILDFASKGGVNLCTDHPIVARHAWNVWDMARVILWVTKRYTNVSPSIIRRVPPCNMVDNSIEYTMAGCFNFPPTLAVVYFELKIEYGEKSRSGWGKETCMKNGGDVPGERY